MDDIICHPSVHEEIARRATEREREKWSSAIEQLQFPPSGITERSVHGFPVFVDDVDWPSIEWEMKNKAAWIHAFHVAAYAAISEYGVAGDPIWNELIRLTDHPKGRS